MTRSILVVGIFFVLSLTLLPSAQVLAATSDQKTTAAPKPAAVAPKPNSAAPKPKKTTAKQKNTTCKLYADSQKLAGKARADWMKKCLSPKNDPRGAAVGNRGATAAPDGPEMEQEPQL